jgi:preprotein translocase subunit Sec61beta
MGDENDPDRMGEAHKFWHPPIAFWVSFFDEEGGRKRQTKVKVDPEDIIAAGGVLIALIIAVAMVFGSIPINKYTSGIVVLSGAGAAIAAIVKARKGKASPWFERTIWILLLILAIAGGVGIYVWLSQGSPPERLSGDIFARRDRCASVLM